MDTVPQERKLRWERLAAVVLAILTLGLLCVILFGWFKKFLIFGTFDFAVGKFVDATGMSIYLVKGVLVIVLIPFFLALQRIGKIPLFKGFGALPKPVAWAIVICYTSAYFLAMYFATKDTYFGHTSGEATKYYAITPEGVRFFDTPGVDPKYGITLQKVTTQVVANLERMKRGDVAKPLVFKSVSDITFFDPLTSDSRVWYSRSSKGELALFSTSGFDPVSGEALKPMTKEVVEEVKSRQAELEAKRAADEMHGQEVVKAAEEAAEKARAETQEKGFRDRYVNPVTRHDKRKLVALVFLGDTDGVTTLQETLSSSLQDRGIEMTDSLFRPDFLSDGSANRLFGGDWALARKLRLSDHVDAVLSVKTSHTLAQTGELDSTLRTASLNLDMKCIDVVNLKPCGSRGTLVRGAGFNDASAIQSSVQNATAEIQKFVKSLGI